MAVEAVIASSTKAWMKSSSASRAAGMRNHPDADARKRRGHFMSSSPASASFRHAEAQRPRLTDSAAVAAPIPRPRR